VEGIWTKHSNTAILVLYEFPILHIHTPVTGYARLYNILYNY